MIIITRSDPPVKYPDKFKPGDIAIAKKFVSFTDGTSHQPGQEIIVRENTKAYYNVCHEDYDRK